MGFFAGFVAPFRGFFRLAARPHLWPWAAIPIVINAIIVAVIAWLWFAYAEPALLSILPKDLGMFSTAVAWIVRAVVWVAAFPLVVAVYLACANLLGGPFYDLLVAKTEFEILGPERARTPDLGLLGAIGTSLRVEAGNLAVSIVGGLIAWFATWALPPFGSLAAVGIGWFLAGFPFIAYPFDRRATSLNRKLGTAFDHLGTTLGFGLAVYVLLIPVVTLPFVAPCAVVGATTLFPGGYRASSMRR